MTRSSVNVVVRHFENLDTTRLKNPTKDVVETCTVMLACLDNRAPNTQKPSSAHSKTYCVSPSMLCRIYLAAVGLVVKLRRAEASTTMLQRRELLATSVLAKVKTDIWRGRNRAEAPHVAVQPSLALQSDQAQRYPSHKIDQSGSARRTDLPDRPI